MDSGKDLKNEPLADHSPSHSIGHTKRHSLRQLTAHNWRSITTNLLFVLLAAFMAVSLVLFVVQSYQVDGQSMEPTLQNSDRLIVNKLPRSLARLSGHAYIPHRGDIIVFNQSALSFGPDVSKQLIKRVIGLPDERVVVKNGILSVYNQAHPDGFQPDVSGLYRIIAPNTVGNVDVSLKTGEIFVCGDNRGNSEDSRYFGPVKAEKIIGKLTLRVLPLNKAQSF